MNKFIKSQTVNLVLLLFAVCVSLLFSVGHDFREYATYIMTILVALFFMLFKVMYSSLVQETE